MKNVFGNNLKQLRKEKGLTQEQLADKIGINRAMIGSYEENRAIPRLGVLQDLSHYFNVSLDTLVNTDIQEHSGSDSMGQDEIGAKNIRVLTTIVDRADDEFITVVPERASAGYLNGYADPDFVESLPRFMLPVSEFSHDRTYRAFQIKGDSMDPIPDGAYIICEYVADWHDIRDGKTYILVTRDEGIVYKRVFLHPSGELFLKADNPSYEPYSIHLGRILEIWKAAGYISPSLPEPDSLSISRIQATLAEMKREIETLKGKQNLSMGL